MQFKDTPIIKIEAPIAQPFLFTSQFDRREKIERVLFSNRYDIIDW